MRRKSKRKKKRQRRKHLYNMWIQIILFILGIILVAIWIIVIVFFTKDIQKIDVVPNQPIVFNPVKKKFTDDYGVGVLKSRRENMNGTILIEYYPQDVEQGDLSPRPDLKAVVVKKEFLKEYSTGKRRIIEILGRHPSEYPTDYSGTSKEELISKEGQVAFMKSKIGNVISGGDEAIEEIMKHYSRIGLSKAEIQKIKSELDVIKKMVLEIRREEKSEIK